MMATRFWAAAAMLLLPPAWCQTPPPSTPTDALYRSDLGYTGYVSAPMPTPLSLLWRHTTQAQAGSAAGPVFADGAVYFGSGASVYAVNADNGTQIWQAKVGGTVETTPSLSGGFLYVGADDGSVVQINAKTGKVGWTFNAGGAVRSSPIASGGTVYVGSADSHFYALDAATGKTRWSVLAGGSITTAPIVFGNQVAVAAADNTVSSYTLSGRLQWSQRLPDDPSPSPPIYADGTIYIAAGQTVMALNSRSGVQRWARALPSDVAAPLTLGPDGLFAVTGERGVLDLSPSRGRKVWSASVAFPGGGPPLLAGGTLLVPAGRGILHAFDAATGTLKWQYQVPASGTASQPKYATTSVNSAPIWTDGTLFVLGDDGTLSAFRADAPDNVPPDASRLSPAPGAVVGGVRVPFGASLSDIGSGIDPASVSLSIDGKPAPLAAWSAADAAIATDATKDAKGSQDVPIKDGPHTMLVQAKDWRGNALSRSWSFTVDNRLNPRVTPRVGVPGTPPPAENAPDDSGNPIAPPPDVAPGPPTLPPPPSGLPQGGQGNPGLPPPPPPI